MRLSTLGGPSRLGLDPLKAANDRSAGLGNISGCLRACWVFGVFATLVFLGCRNDTPEAQPVAPPPETYGTFLDERAGVPPESLVPEHVTLEIRAARDVEALSAQMLALSAAEEGWFRDGSGTAEFIEKWRYWYAPLDQLRRLRDAIQANSDPVEVHPRPPSLPSPLPLARISFSSFQDVSCKEVLDLVQAGARGHLVLWYPVTQLRERLLDGRAGVWRGITRLREELCEGGPALGGTPVLLAGAVAELDRPKESEGLPSGFTRLLAIDRWLGLEGERAERVRTLGQVGKGAERPALSDLPVVWRRLFTGPSQGNVVFLVPSSPNVMERAFDDAVEGLMPIVREGGQAWLLIGLPLAQEHKPERF